MAKKIWNNHAFRGVLQSNDGVIAKVLEKTEKTITFEASFRLSDNLVDMLKTYPKDLIYSERSRIARLGIQIINESSIADTLKGDTLTLRLKASPVIPGYPGFEEIEEFFTIGLPIGRIVFCDPEALLTSDEVIGAIERSELKLPASTTISSDGSIFIAPHKVICELNRPLLKDSLERILLREDGREILNLYQARKKVKAVVIPPNEGVITTCSMYLNEHYVVLQSGNNSSFEFGRHLPATILDPIKTRGIRIYLEIINGSQHPIVNPLISAKIYHAKKSKNNIKSQKTSVKAVPFSYSDMREFEKSFGKMTSQTCHFLGKPIALVSDEPKGLEKAKIFLNGPDKACHAAKAICSIAKRDFSPKTECAHIYATYNIKEFLKDDPAQSYIIVLKFFPNIVEHHDIIDLAFEGRVHALYFFEPSGEHGPFLSERDHNRLQEYNAFGIEVYWVSGLNNRLMIHTMRDRKGYFVIPDKLASFHKSMLFAFYGSNKELSNKAVVRLGELMDALISFWGKNIGIVTGGGSGVMRHANTLARERGILSGANFLDITDQSLNTDVDFCQIFQSSCRHSRQKWFEVASFPIFNVGGLGSLEELGITLCNMKLSIIDPVPIILFNTEGDGDFWSGMEKQIYEMVGNDRAPRWIIDNLIMTNDPKVVIDAYRERLQLF